jgi:hypothetical protein
MTLKRAMVEFFRRHKPQRFTDGELAAYLDAPEPSVRRARLALEREGVLEAGNMYAGRATWRLTPQHRR